VRTSVQLRRLLAILATLALLGSIVAIAPAAVAGAGGTREIARAGTGSINTGSFTPSGGGGILEDEFPGGDEDAEGAGPNPFDGTISLANGQVGHGASATAAKAKSNPTFKLGFQGLNLYQQRYARGGNQFTVEPPDQGMCAGNGYVVEAVNDVMNVFHQSDGTSALPDNTSTNIVGGLPRNVNHAVDLNSFYGYAPAINRSTGVRAQFVTDPTCIYDAATHRFFVVVLTLESTPGGALTLVNHLDLAVSATSNPTGSWNIYRIDVTNDGTNTGGSNPGPYLGDYPHIGADANGFYITTNAYPWCCNGFAGAQIYAFSKAQLAAGAASVTMAHIDTSGMVNAPSDAGSTQPGFTVWPAQSPNASQFNTAAHGTEYFVSSNAADEATHPVAGTGGNYQSSKIVVWTLTNTSSLNTASPSLNLTNRLVTVNPYALPPKQKQPGSGTAPGINAPQGHCLNDTTTTLFNGFVGCWALLVGASNPTEVVSRPDSNDTRMQQVVYANGKLWGALDTAVTVGPEGSTENRAGIAWFIVNPSNGSVTRQGDFGEAGHDFTYPAIGVTAAGRGIMAFTATGDSLYPSAAYAPIDASAGVGAWNVVPGGEGAAPDDGFTSYKAQVGNPPRTRWGDYGAASADGSSIWIASEYIAAACDYATWGGPFFQGGTGDNLLGTCAPTAGGVGIRAALGNWSTFISKFTP
jgi:hypothetical protein